MKINKLFYILLLLTIFCHSCVEDVDINKDMNIVPRLVLYSRICPQTDTIYLHLSNSQPLLNNTVKDIKEVENAVVEISADRSHWTRMRYNPEKKRYILPQTEFRIREGQTYYVKASAPGYKEVFSSCKVPYFRETNLRTELRLAKGDTHWGEYYADEHYDLYIHWDDYRGEENYYTFLSSELYYYIDMIWDSYYHEDTLNYYDHHYFYDEETSDFCFTDAGKDGQRLSFLYYSEFDPEYIPELPKFYFMQLDRNFYLYETSLNDYDIIFSFLMEPGKTYNNIQNGYGLFGAYTRREYNLSQMVRVRNN